jgi:hypothetical protein
MPLMVYEQPFRTIVLARKVRQVLGLRWTKLHPTSRCLTGKQSADCQYCDTGATDPALSASAGRTDIAAKPTAETRTDQPVTLILRPTLLLCAQVTQVQAIQEVAVRG